MKKSLKIILITLCVFLLCSVLTSEPKTRIPTTTEYRGVSVFITHDGFANIRCYKCKYCTDVSCKGYSYCLGCTAWRKFEIPIKKEGKAAYATYRCQHGHELLVSLTTEDLK